MCLLQTTQFTIVLQIDLDHYSEMLQLILLQHPVPPLHPDQQDLPGRHSLLRVSLSFKTHSNSKLPLADYHTCLPCTLLLGHTALYVLAMVTSTLGRHREPTDYGTACLHVIV